MKLSTHMIRIAIVVSLVSGCKLESATTDGDDTTGGKADEGWATSAHSKASSVLLTPEEPSTTLGLSIGATKPVTIRIAPMGTRYTNGEEWETDFLARYARGEVSSEECIEALRVSGSGLASTSVQFCLVPIIGLDHVEKVARPATVTASASNGRLSVELYAAPAATRAGHQEIWFFTEATW